MSKRSCDSRRILKLNDHPAGDGAVLYVMAREGRVADNWALLAAYERARERKVALLVLFALAPMFNHGSARHNEWMVASLQEVAAGLAKLRIPFYIEMGVWTDVVVTFVSKHSVGEVFFDFNPLQPVAQWRSEAAKRLQVAVNVVDGRNIVPCWQASPKAEFAAYTFRPKVTRLLPEFLVEFPTLTAIANNIPYVTPPIDWEKVRAYRACDYTEVIPTLFVPGAHAARQMLEDFIAHRLPGYATRRNDPNERGVSDLSPYLRWGNISAQRVALAVTAVAPNSDDRRAFLEELVVRRELSDNYCYYTDAYATVASLHPWAQRTITEHAADSREYLYTYEQFRDAQTHDQLWNAAQMQMVLEGKMHGFMRMYWAKKILEWTPDAQTAIDIALTLNDHYQLDGRDSNGVAGVMWSIGGLHDRAWNERTVFGKIRYMNYAGCKRKFDVKAYEAKFAGSLPGTLFG